MHVDSPAPMSQSVTKVQPFLCGDGIRFKKLSPGVPPLGRPVKLCLVTVCQPAKFSSSSYNGWSIRITGMTNFWVLWVTPFWGMVVSLTPTNLCMGLTCYHAILGGSATMSPTAES